MGIDNLQSHIYQAVLSSFPPDGGSNENTLERVVKSLVARELLALQTNTQNRLRLVEFAQEEGILGVDATIVDGFGALDADKQKKLAKLAFLNGIAEPWFRDPMIAFQKRIDADLDLEACFDVQYQWPYTVKVDLGGYTPISRILRLLKAKFDKFFKKLVSQIAAKYNCYLVLEDGGDAFTFSFQDPDQAYLLMMEMKNLNLIPFLEEEYSKTGGEDYKEMARLIGQLPETTFSCAMLKFDPQHLIKRHIDSPEIRQAMTCSGGSVFEKAITSILSYVENGEALMPGNVYDAIQAEDKSTYFELAVLVDKGQDKVAFMSAEDFAKENPPPSRARVYERFDGNQLVDVLLVTEARAKHLGINWHQDQAAAESAVGNQEYKENTAKYRYYLAKRPKEGAYSVVKSDERSNKPIHAFSGRNLFEMPNDNLDKLLMGVAKMHPRGTLSRLERHEVSNFPTQLVCCLQFCSLDQLPGDSNRFDGFMIDLQKKLQELGADNFAPMFKQDENKIDITMRLGNSKLDAVLRVIKEAVDQLKILGFEAVAGVDAGPCEIGSVSGGGIIGANRAMSAAKKVGYAMMILSRAVGLGRLSESILVDLGNADLKGYAEKQRVFVFGEAMKKPLFVGMQDLVARLETVIADLGQVDKPGTAFVQGSGSNALLDYAEGFLRHAANVAVISYDPLADRQNGKGFFDRILSGIADVKRADLSAGDDPGKVMRLEAATCVNEEYSLSAAIGNYTGKPIVVVLKNTDHIPPEILTVFIKMTQSFPGRFSLLGSFAEGALTDLAPDQTLFAENLTLDDTVARILHRHYHVDCDDGAQLVELLHKKYKVDAEEIKKQIIGHPLYAQSSSEDLPFDIVEQFVAMSKKTPSGKWEFNMSETREVIGEAADVLAVASLMHGDFAITDLRAVANGFFGQNMTDTVLEGHLNSFVAQEGNDVQLSPFLTRSDTGFRCLASTLRRSDHYIEPYPQNRDKLIAAAYTNHLRRFNLAVEGPLQIDDNNFEAYRQAFNLLERMQVRNGREDDLKRLAIALDSYAARTGRTLQMREELHVIGVLLQPSGGSTELDQVAWINNRMHYAQAMILSDNLDVADKIITEAIDTINNFSEPQSEDLKVAITNGAFELANLRRMKREKIILTPGKKGIEEATGSYLLAHRVFDDQKAKLPQQSYLPRIQAAMLSAYDLYTELQTTLQSTEKLEELSQIQQNLAICKTNIDQIERDFQMLHVTPPEAITFEFRKSLALARRIWLLAFRTYVLLKKSLKQDVVADVEAFYDGGLSLRAVYVTEVRNPIEEMLLLEVLISPFFHPVACFSEVVPSRFANIKEFAVRYKSIIDQQGDNLDPRIQIHAYTGIGEIFRFEAQSQEKAGNNAVAKIEYEKAIKEYKKIMRLTAIPGLLNQQYILFATINILNCSYHLAELGNESYVQEAEAYFTQQLSHFKKAVPVDRINTALDWVNENVMDIFQTEGCDFGRQNISKLQEIVNQLKI